MSEEIKQLCKSQPLEIRSIVRPIEQTLFICRLVSYWKGRDKKDMLLLDRLQEILILHRQLDYNDEDATLEEQGEKILYFFSASLDAMDVKEQLSIATLAEALIELTNKFSPQEKIQTVVMHRKFWTFMECEPGIWIIIAFLNNSEAITSAKYNPNNITSDQVISVDVYRSFLLHFYSLYFTMNGSIQSYLLGNEKKGLIVIDDIMKIQKKIRKLRKKISIKESDIKKFEMDKDAFIPESHESLEELNQQLQELHSQLMILLDHPQYTLPLLRMKLSNYIQWYLYQENLNNISIFANMRNLASTEGRKLKYCVAAVHRLLNNVKSALPELSIKCILSYQNKLLWTDIDDNTSTNIMEFFYRCDHTIKLGNANRRLRIATEEFTKSLFHESRCDYSVFDARIKEKLFLSLKEKELRLQGRYGVFQVNGQTLNLDTFLTALNSSPGISISAIGGDRSQKSSDASPSDETELLARILSSDGFRVDDKTLLYYPKVYLRSNETNNNSTSNHCIGRLLHFSFGKLTLSCILKETDELSQFKDAAIRQVLSQPTGIVARRVKISWIYDQLYNTNNNNNNSIVDPLTSSMESLPVSEKDVKRIQMLLLTYLTQRAVRQELEKIENNDWNKYFLLYNYYHLDSGGNINTNNNTLSTRFQSISTVNNSLPSTASATVPAAALQANNLMIAAAGNGVGANGVLTNNGGDYVNPTTIRGLVLPKAIQDRDSKVFYFTRTLAGIKLYNRDSGDISIPFFLVPDSTNDVRSIIANSPLPIPSSSISSSNNNSAIPTTKAIEIMLDQYFYQQTVQGPFTALFFQCLTHCYGLIAMKALMDIWKELDGGGEGNVVNEFSRAKKFVCTRVSALQRGGTWIIGKKLLSGETLFIVMNQCSSFYDVMDIVENVMKDITKK